MQHFISGKYETQFSRVFTYYLLDYRFYVYIEVSLLLLGVEVSDTFGSNYWSTSLHFHIPLHIEFSFSIGVVKNCTSNFFLLTKSSVITKD